MAVRNRLLSILAPDDFDDLEPKLERVPMPLQAVLITARQPISHCYFPESGVVSTVANTEEGRIEVGITGREGFVGIPVFLGAGSSPHTSFAQGAGEALRITAVDLQSAIAARPSIARPLGIFVHAMMVQVAQTAYANVTLTIEARLARWILMTQDRTDSEELVLTHDFLSKMLGVRRPGVTVATHVLEGTGSIRARRGKIIVRDRDMLRDIARDAYHVAEAEYERAMALLPAGVARTP